MFSGQRFESIEGDELYRRLALGHPVVLLDVRTAQERSAEGRQAGTRHVPLEKMERHSLGGLGPHAGQAAQRIHQLAYQRRHCIAKKAV